MKPSIQIALLAYLTALTACGSNVSDTSTPAASDPTTTTAVAETSKSDKRIAGEEAQPLQHWRAFGTEPFWNVTADGNRLTFTTPDDQQGRVFVAASNTGGDAPTFSGAEERMQFSLTLKREPCSDGMSDNQYALAATFNFGDMSYQGCAEQAK